MAIETKPMKIDKEKILNIINDFMSKNDTQVTLSIEFKSNFLESAYAKPLNEKDNEYCIVFQEDKLERLAVTYNNKHDKFANILLDISLHEAAHIIVNKKGKSSKDGSYDFEKFLYDNYIKPSAETSKKTIRKLLSLSEEEYCEYNKDREDSFKCLYLNYINYLKGDIENI